MTNHIEWKDCNSDRLKSSIWKDAVQSVSFNGDSEVIDAFSSITSSYFYVPPASLHVDKRLPSGTLDGLLSSIASGCRPTSVLKQLHNFKALVQQRDGDKLEEALKELHNTSSMSPGQRCITLNVLSDKYVRIFACS